MTQFDDSMREINTNLRREIDRLGDRMRPAMQEIGQHIKGESQEIAPHDKGDLIGSAFYSTDLGTGRKNGRRSPRLRVGYTVDHAPHVHEMPDTTNWSKPGTGNKFLDKAVVSSHTLILDIIAFWGRIR